MKKMLLAGLMVFCFILFAGCSQNGAGDAISKGIEDKGIKANDIIEASGVVKSNKRENIFIDFPAVIKEIHVDEGERVKKGDVLFTLDIEEFEDQILDKERTLNISKMQLENVKSNIIKEKNSIKIEEQEVKISKDELDKKTKEYSNNSNPDIKKLKNQLKQANEKYTAALEDLKKKEQLYEIDGVSKQEYDEFKRFVEDKKRVVQDTEFSIESKNDDLKREIEDLKVSIDQKERSIKLSKEKVESNENVRIQQERVANIERELERLKNKMIQPYLKENNIITQLNDGIVYEIKPVEGDNVSEGSNIISVLDAKQMYIEADIAEKNGKDVKVGANVIIKPLADKSRVYKGKVTDVFSKAVEKSDDTFIRAKISIDNADEFLILDMNVDVEIEK